MPCQVLQNVCQVNMIKLKHKPKKLFPYRVFKLNDIINLLPHMTAHFKMVTDFGDEMIIDAEVTMT